MKEYKLQDICRIEKGKQIDTAELNDKSPYKYINGGIKESGYYHEYNTSGEVVLVSEGGASCGFVNYITEKFWCGCHCYRLTESKILPKYLYYALKGNQSKIMELRSGAAMPNIKKETFKNLILSLDEDKNAQKNVVLALDNIQTAIDSKKTQLLALDELVKSRFIEMFGKCFEDKSRLVKISTLAAATIGLTYKPENVSEEGTIVLRSGNIQNTELYLEKDIVRIANIKIKDDKYVRENDILMCSRNGSAKLVGKCCRIPKLDEPMTYGAFMTVVRSIYPYFLNGFFNSTYFTQQLTGTQTASVNQITTGMLNNYDVICPTNDEENDFAEFVKLIDKSKFIVQQQIKDLEELLDSKMDEYFR